MLFNGVKPMDYLLIKNVSIPSWFVEGLAMKFSKEFSFLHKIEISKAIWKNTLIPLDGLKNFNTKNKFQVKLAYAQAAAANQPPNENRDVIKTMLITLGFQQKFIDKALRLYEVICHIILYFIKQIEITRTTASENIWD